MLVKPDEQRPLADLLQFLEMGEQLAHDCAHAQAALAPTPRMCRFLRGQASQEALHACLFKGAVKWVAPRQQKGREAYPPLQHYHALIRRALDQGDFIETVLAEQVILECLGEAILNQLEVGLEKRNAPFTRLRHLILRQEAAHHGFGERVLEQAVADGEISHAALREKALPYLQLSQSLILDLQERLEDIDENPHTYIQKHQALLPAWLMDPAGYPKPSTVEESLPVCHGATLSCIHRTSHFQRKHSARSAHPISGEACLGN